ncbi:MAG: LacI family DNA-binding transcriptional regulator [Clostridiales bacterium]|nr:LacI family DNA-binding transcriptional regulator [Clostridiales bacterium]
MASRVTIQDIADSLSLSRNTVSKALNNTGILADATKDRILKRAAEMGYKQFSYAEMASMAEAAEQKSPVTPPKDKADIALFTTGFLGDSHFASLMLDKFQQEITSLGYSFTMYRLLPADISKMQLPTSFNKERTAGIICVEMFDYDYCQMLCGLDLALLFVDTPVIGLRAPLKADCLYMNNQAHIYTFVGEMVRRGKTKFGFIGEYNHCQSFFERYIAYRDAMFLSGQVCSDAYCITNRSTNTDSLAPVYQDFILESLKAMPELPEVFICANDFIAIDALNAFRMLDISVPDDVYLCGFDDSPESRLITPNLTTIHIHTQIMGFSATQLILSRIEQPSLDYRTVYAETDIVYRASTGD